jgi:mxaJ protein
VLDAAVVWGPIAGYFAKRVPNARLRVDPLRSEPDLPLEFDIAMGVRRADGEWRDTLDRLIAENRAQIDAILHEYGVPLLEPGSEVER